MSNSSFDSNEFVDFLTDTDIQDYLNYLEGVKNENRRIFYEFKIIYLIFI